MERKNAHTTFRLTPAEKLKLARVARRWRVNQSEVVRVLIANLDEKSVMRTIIATPETPGQNE